MFPKTAALRGGQFHCRLPHSGCEPRISPLSMRLAKVGIGIVTVAADPKKPGGVQAFRFSTERTIGAHERVDAWSEVLGRHCGVRIDVNPRSAEDFRQSARIARSSTFGLIEGSTSPIRQESSRSLAVNDDVTFCSVTTSRWGVSQLGRSPDLHPGDWTLISNNDVNLITVPERVSPSGVLCSASRHKISCPRHRRNVRAP